MSWGVFFCVELSNCEIITVFMLCSHCNVHLFFLGAIINKSLWTYPLLKTRTVYLSTVTCLSWLWCSVYCRVSLFCLFAVLHTKTLKHTASFTIMCLVPCAFTVTWHHHLCSFCKEKESFFVKLSLALTHCRCWVGGWVVLAGNEWTSVRFNFWFWESTILAKL